MRGVSTAHHPAIDKVCSMIEINLAEPIPGGHLAALSQPEALVSKLLRISETIDGRR